MGHPNRPGQQVDWLGLVTTKKAIFLLHIGLRIQCGLYTGELGQPGAANQVVESGVAADRVEKWMSLEELQDI